MHAPKFRAIAELHPSYFSAIVRGARQNNLKGFDLDLPLGKLTVVQSRAHSGPGRKVRTALQDCNVAMKLRPGFFRTSLRANINQHLGRDKDSLSDLNLVISLHADDETDALAISQRAWLHALSQNPAVTIQRRRWQMHS